VSEEEEDLSVTDALRPKRGEEAAPKSGYT
jgi:hypothetical protein